MLTPAVISRDGSVIANLQPGDAYSNPTQLKADGTKSGANRLVEGTDYIVVPRSTVDLIRQQRGRYTDIRKGPNALEFVFEPTYTSTRQVFDHGRQRTQVRVRVDSKGNAVRDVTQERQQCSGDCDMQSDGWTTDHAYTRIQQTVSGVDSTGRQRRLLVRDVKVNPSTGEAMANVDTTYGQVGNRHGITNIKITAVGEDNGYQLGVNGNVFADQAGKSLTRDQAKEALRSLYGEGNEGLAEEDFDNIAAEAVNSGYFSSVEGGGFSMAFNALNWGQFFGKILRAREFLGISQGLSLIFDNYGDYVAERRAQLEQDFCIANGIANCIASKYCANQQPIQPQNTVLGISREGLLEPVIRLNAERTQQLILQGATAQQLIELLGTDTIIKDGRKINLSDPNLNPQVTRNLSLRLYHIQYHLVNNMQINPLEQNGEIKYNLAIGTGNEQTFSGINYYTQDKTLPFGQKTKPQDSDIYKYSFTEYETACLKLHPGIIVGNVQGSRHKRNIYCVALVDMIGDPTSITPPEGTLQANATRPAATADGEFW
ncbi:hypothetical protein COV18_05435 [Candidatus Woesearchaeota archaeon CG10_big_fil_rev_8_21_14_0_10_37_12]|nr:MAG: hypothetical protein COV18_05435 [Candidatus Woesearchaeota archaeon CG10_big_fil_rev_8_21_14_0_10_37_12]